MLTFFSLPSETAEHFDGFCSTKNTFLMYTEYCEFLNSIHVNNVQIRGSLAFKSAFSDLCSAIRY